MTTPSTATSPGTAQAGKEPLKLPLPNAGPQSIILSREEPFGLTVIIGGTNVRFCISHRGSSQPLTHVVKWIELKEKLVPELATHGLNLELAHSLVYPVIVKGFVDFLKSKFDPAQGPLPIANLCAFNISIAGLVIGDEKSHPDFKRPVNGIDAEVTTSNTGLRFSREKIGRVLYKAFKELVPDMQFPPEKVSVFNDARAGQEGEKILLGIPNEKRVFFEIGGTGEGSQYDIPGYDEIGHRIIANAHPRKLNFVSGDKLQEYINPDGSFKVLDDDRTYAEHLVAGPWTGIRFVQQFKGKSSVMSALAKWMLAERARKRAEKLEKEPKDSHPEEKPVTPSELSRQLDDIASLKSSDRHRWAIDSNALILREISELICKPDYRKLWRYMPCDHQIGALEEHSPDKAIVVHAWSSLKMHFKERGQIAGKVYREMKSQGVAPDYYILGGGLGEGFNQYSSEQREDAILEITEAGRLPHGLFNFSQVSPEARESAISHRTVMQTQAEWERLRTLKVPNITGGF
jgi:hypothetical protein